MANRDADGRGAKLTKGASAPRESGPGRALEPTSVAALVLGAGKGKRLGHAIPKAFVPIAGTTLIERSIRALADSNVVGWIQPVLDAGEFERFKSLGPPEIANRGAQTARIAQPVAGGAERQDSVRTGLASLPKEIEWVAVHDAARCLVSSGDIRRVVEAATRSGAAILAEPVRDTIKLVRGGQIVETPPRESCWAAQTPQVVRRDWLEAASEKAAAAGRLGTDDAQLLEWAGYAVEIVPASAPNPKITLPADLDAAAAWLASEAGGGAG